MEKALRLLLVGLGASPLLVVGCGGGTPPTMQGRTGMLSQTAIAAKCTEAAKGHERPFVVEWDATDLASFEAKAASNTMFVHYEGCKLDILYECKDPNVNAKFGNYGQPQFTSGTVQGFDIANEGELYAKLPLGAGSLSGRVSAGETLHLKYFVSGVAMSTRDSLYKGEIDPIPGCANATHFVSSYNLGAFELESTAKSAGEANAGVGNIGAGGSRSHNEASVGRGGDLVSCTTQDQRACRVPIRLVLKAITPGSHPAGNLTAGGPPPGGGAPGTAPALPPGLQEQMAVSEEVSQAIGKANELAGEGDGAGCLAKLDRAMALDARRADQTRQTYARCLMMAGKCDEGQKMYRDVRAAEDTKRLLSDETLDKEAHDRANNMCPSSTAKSAADFVMRAANEMGKAARAKDLAVCKQKFEAIDAKLEQAEKDDREASKNKAYRTNASNMGKQALQSGAQCIAEASKSCDEGLKYYKRYYAHALRNMKGTDKIATESWGTQVKQGQIKCQ
jgi:hypothetical protein